MRTDYLSDLPKEIKPDSTERCISRDTYIKRTVLIIKIIFMFYLFIYLFKTFYLYNFKKYKIITNVIVRQVDKKRTFVIRRIYYQDAINTIYIENI